MVADNGIYRHLETLEHSLHARQKLHRIPHHIAREDHSRGVSRGAILLDDGTNLGQKRPLELRDLSLGLGLCIAYNNEVEAALLSTALHAQSHQHQGNK